MRSRSASRVQSQVEAQRQAFEAKAEGAKDKECADTLTRVVQVH